MAAEERYRGSRAFLVATEKLGGPTGLRERKVEVSEDVIQVLENNPRRLMWLIVNRAMARAAIGFSYRLRYGEGIILGANGGTAIMTVLEDGESVAFPVYGVLEYGSGIFYVLEVMGG